MRFEAKVLLIGCGPTTLTALESLAERFHVVEVIREANDDPVCRRAAELSVPVSGDTAPRAVEAALAKHTPDCVVISSYNRILPARVLGATRFVNVHYALLPKYRGRANVNWAILNGEAETGISIHVACGELDAGNILFQQALLIGPTDTVTDLYEKLNQLQREHLGATVAKHLAGYAGEQQDERDAIYGCTRLPQDGMIDWNWPTHRIDALIRSLTPPYPGAFTYLNGDVLRVWRAEPCENAPWYDGRIAGRVVRVSKTEGWAEVLTGDGVLRVYEVETRVTPRGPAATVLRSVKETLGVSLPELMQRFRLLEAELAKSNPHELCGVERE